MYSCHILELQKKGYNWLVHSYDHSWFYWRNFFDGKWWTLYRKWHKCDEVGSCYFFYCYWFHFYYSTFCALSEETKEIIVFAGDWKLNVNMIMILFNFYNLYHEVRNQILVLFPFRILPILNIIRIMWDFLHILSLNYLNNYF